MATVKNPATIYWKNGFGSITKFEVNLIELQTGQKYAQYENVPKVWYVKKGKRKTEGMTQTYDPYMLILKGHGHPETNGMFNAATVDANGTETRMSTYSSFDKRYQTDFDALIDKYIEEQKPEVLGDFRATKGFNATYKH